MKINTDFEELKTMSDYEYYERYLENHCKEAIEEALNFTEYKREFLETDKLFVEAK